MLGQITLQMLADFIRNVVTQEFSLNEKLIYRYNSLYLEESELKCLPAGNFTEIHPNTIVCTIASDKKLTTITAFPMGGYEQITVVK